MNASSAQILSWKCLPAAMASLKRHELGILTSDSPTIKTRIRPPFGKVCAKSPNLTPGFPFTGTTLISSRSSVLNLPPARSLDKAFSSFLWACKIFASRSVKSEGSSTPWEVGAVAGLTLCLVIEPSLSSESFESFLPFFRSWDVVVKDRDARNWEGLEDDCLNSLGQKMGSGGLTHFFRRGVDVRSRCRILENFTCEVR